VSLARFVRPIASEANVLQNARMTSVLEAEIQAAAWREMRRQNPGDERSVVMSRDALILLALAHEAAGDDPQAIEAWREAEEQQWQMGTWSTGSGEGLASMGCVYELMLRRANAELRLAGTAAGDSADAHRNNAHAILDKIAADPNGVGERVLCDKQCGLGYGMPLPRAPRPPRK
jgi:hypothetical protein